MPELVKDVSVSCISNSKNNIVESVLSRTSWHAAGRGAIVNVKYSAKLAKHLYVIVASNLE